MKTEASTNQSAFDATSDPGCAAGMAWGPHTDEDGPHHPVIIELANVLVEFAGFKALNVTSFYVDRHELRFLIGPNGAGKTTLLDAICRKVDLAEGRILYDGNTELNRLSVSAVARLGIARKFQAPSIFSGLSVWQNIELAYPKAQGVFGGLVYRRNSEAQDRIAEVLRFTSLLESKDLPAVELSHGQKQWLELGMTIIQQPKLLLVDEPVAGMTESERIRTGELLTEVAQNCSVLIVEHDMHFVRRFSKSVTVLHEGRVLCEGTFDSVSSNQAVIDVYLGRGRPD